MRRKDNTLIFIYLFWMIAAVVSIFIGSFELFVITLICFYLDLVVYWFRRMRK